MSMTPASDSAASTPSAPQVVLTAERATFDHGARSRFNAWFFSSLDRYFNYILRPHKTGAFHGMTAGTVVELGAGAGANIRLLPPGTHLIAVEPNVQMHRTLRDRANAAGVRMTLVPGVAESLLLDDASVDEVMCTLVLCTVQDQEQALAEIKRVLRPGGRFRFVEHVAAPRWSPRRWLQVALRRPWGWVFEGCDPARDTQARLHAAGFSSITVERRKWRRSAFFPVNTAIWGIAVR